MSSNPVEPKPAMSKQYMRQKQKRLADKHHTCTCEEGRCSFLNSSPLNSKLVDMDLENNDLESPYGRFMWWIQDCLRCRNVILRGTNLSDYRATGNRLLETALKKGKGFQNPELVNELWEMYNSKTQVGRVVRERQNE